MEDRKCHYMGFLRVMVAVMVLMASRFWVSFVYHSLRQSAGAAKIYFQAETVAVAVACVTMLSSLLVVLEK